MFNNPGEKLKTLSSIVFYVQLVLILYIIVSMIGTGKTLIIVLCAFGLFFNYVVSLAIYAFGDLVANTAFLQQKAQRDYLLDIKKEEAEEAENN